MNASDSVANTPSWLTAYESLYRRDPRAASLAWFREARFGLFLHYGVYSLLGRGEWVMFHDRIPVSEYEKLKDRFTAERFNADAIADLAAAAGMKYVNMTTRHHDSFCLFRTQATSFNSVESPARRDLISELADACRRRGLGIFFYYSYALDWRHPYFYSCDRWHAARPHYDHPEPRYKFRKDEDFRRYIEFVHAQLEELLTQYGPIAGVWFDPIMGYYYAHDLFPVEETYALVRRLQPHCLIAFKTGATGDEDFASPEHSAEGLADRLRRQNAPEHVVRVAERAWERNKKNPRNEICTTMTDRHWGWNSSPDIRHKSVEEVLEALAAADAANCNLLLNTGPLPDGAIDPTDEKVLRQVGQWIREHGWPRSEPPARNARAPEADSDEVGKDGTAIGA